MEPQDREQMPFLMLLPNLVDDCGDVPWPDLDPALPWRGRFETAVILLMLSAVIDGMDGLIARRLRATSEFGAELDSLSDFLCFGVAPGLLVYRFALGEGECAGLDLRAGLCRGLLPAAGRAFNVMRGEEGGSGAAFHRGAGACGRDARRAAGVPEPGRDRRYPRLSRAGRGLAGAGRRADDLAHSDDFAQGAAGARAGGWGVLLMATVIGQWAWVVTRLWLLAVVLDLALCGASGAGDLEDARAHPALKPFGAIRAGADSKGPGHEGDPALLLSSGGEGGESAASRGRSAVSGDGRGASRVSGPGFGENAPPDARASGARFESGATRGGRIRRGGALDGGLTPRGGQKTLREMPKFSSAKLGVPKKNDRNTKIPLAVCGADP